MKVVITDAIKAKVIQIKQEYGSAVNSGSNNYEAAIRNGLIVGEPVYAASVPHHSRSNGAWSYVNMFCPTIEAALTILFETVEPVTINDAVIRWSENEGYSLVVGDNLLPIDENLLDFDTETNSVENDDESFDYYGITIKRGEQ